MFLMLVGFFARQVLLLTNQNKTNHNPQKSQQQHRQQNSQKTH